MFRDIDTLENMRNKIAFANENYQTYVYIDKEKIVATTSIMYEHKIRYHKPKAYIEDVAVCNEYRGRGIGKEMVEYCVGVAKKKNCYKIVLSCKDDLVDFYKSLGFHKEQNFMVIK